MNNVSKKSLLSKYASIIVSVVLFLLLTAAILGFNYIMSQRINKDTTAINLSARQDILVEQLAKGVMNVDLLSQFSGDDKLSAKGIPIAIDRLRESRDLFDHTLTAFEEGGDATGISGETVSLNQVTNPLGARSIQNAKKVWLPYRRLIDSFLNDYEKGNIDAETIRFASDYARIFNGRLFNQMNDLNTSLADQANQKTNLVQTVGIVGLVSALLLFAYIVFGALRKLIGTDKELEEAKEATDNIMRTVNEGLFLVDNSLMISPQYSAQLESIINQQDIAGKQLIDILEPMTSSKKIETLKKFIRQLFNEKVKEKLIQDLNPLRQVELEVEDENGNYDTRYLSFNFSRVYRDKSIINVLASVSDITRAVILEERLEKEREQNDQQVALLANILHTDEATMSGFIRHAKKVTANINEVLKRPESGERGLKQKTQDMFREIHGLKGEASALQLEDFVSICTDFEDQVSTLQRKNRLVGNDFLSLTVGLEDLINTTNRVGAISDRLSGKNDLSITELTSKTGSASTAEVSVSTPKTVNLTQHFSKYATQVAERNGKQVIFRATGLDEFDSDDTERLDTIRDTITQMVRNAVVHGIELPNIREANNKKATGIVQVKLDQANNNILQLTIDDDGNGIDIDKLKRLAIEKGIYSEAQLSSLNKQQLYQLIFHSGLSTADSVGEDAGRGVGMDVIKERVKQLNGKIGILSEPGKYTRFVIQFPL